MKNNNSKFQNFAQSSVVVFLTLSKFLEQNKRMKNLGPKNVNYFNSILPNLSNSKTFEYFFS